MTFLALVAAALVTTATAFEQQENNWKPVIGVLSQPLPNGKAAIIAASYVKFVESGGGRVVPVHFGASDEELEFYFQSINGVLFPGGNADLSPEKTFYKAEKFFLTKAIEAFDSGDYFPVWGTCLGFESLLQMVSGNSSLIKSFPIQDRNTPHKLSFCQPAIQSRMFPPLTQTVLGTCSAHPQRATDPSSAFLPKKTESLRRAQEWKEAEDCGIRLLNISAIVDSLESEPLVYFNHKDGATVADWNYNDKLNEFFAILSTTTVGGVTFVSTMEGRKYPVYGVLYHPEKNLFESSPVVNAPSSLRATLVAQYFSSFLVEEARKSLHRFPNMTSLRQNLIYRYSPTDTTNDTGRWAVDQTYIFDLRRDAETVE